MTIGKPTFIDRYIQLAHVMYPPSHLSSPKPLTGIG